MGRKIYLGPVSWGPTEGKKERRSFSRGIYDYLSCFFHSAPLSSKLVMIAFFSVSLMIPILGEPSGGTTARLLEPGLVFFGLNAVFFLTGVIVFRFYLRLDDERLKEAGRTIMRMILIPITLYALSAVLTAVLGHEVISVLRATSSMVMIVPVVLVITVLVESVIRHGIVENGSRVPLGLVLLTIFLAMYTFATVYYVNGLLFVPNTSGAMNGQTQYLAANFSDAFYYSGLIFTTLGSANIYPVGMGRAITLFESVTGYLVLGFLTAIFIQALISARGGEHQ